MITLESPTQPQTEAPKWADNAFALLKEYLEETTLFQCEDFRYYCQHNNLPMPRHLRSFAAVIVRAKNAGLITHAGYDKVENTKAHHAMANVWKVVR